MGNLHILAKVAIKYYTNQTNYQLSLRPQFREIPSFNININRNEAVEICGVEDCLLPFSIAFLGFEP
ncbi:MAG: hypothetical protein ACI85I_001280 [Arenicella sp.]|jgi:hypothetical protein